MRPARTSMSYWSCYRPCPQLSCDSSSPNIPLLQLGARNNRHTSYTATPAPTSPQIEAHASEFFHIKTGTSEQTEERLSLCRSAMRKEHEEQDDRDMDCYGLLQLAQRSIQDSYMQFTDSPRLERTLEQLAAIFSSVYSSLSTRTTALREYACASSPWRSQKTQTRRLTLKATEVFCAAEQQRRRRLLWFGHALTYSHPRSESIALFNIIETAFCDEVKRYRTLPDGTTPSRAAH